MRSRASPVPGRGHWGWRQGAASAPADNMQCALAVFLVLCREERCKAAADPCCCCSEQKDDPDEEKLAREMKEFGDIVRIDMVDTYADLSMKTMRMFSALPQKVRGTACTSLWTFCARAWRKDILGSALSHALKAARGLAVGLSLSLGSLSAAALCRHPWWLSTRIAEKVQGRWVTTVSALHCKQQTLISCMPLSSAEPGGVGEADPVMSAAASARLLLMECPWGAAAAPRIAAAHGCF